jgi:hypothetical protein
MSRTTKQQTSKSSKQIDASSESVREQIAKTLIADAETMLAKATDKNYESIAATARLCERLAHAILFDMTRARK